MKDPVGLFSSACPDHGVISVVVTFGPQVPGVVSVPFGPPLRRSLKELNVAWGFSSTTAVSWPVFRFGNTLPTRRTLTPYRVEKAWMNIRNCSPLVGSLLFGAPT